jgi:hypothetical protein
MIGDAMAFLDLAFLSRRKFAEDPVSVARTVSSPGTWV